MHHHNLSRLGLGCMRFFRDKKESERVILEAIAQGIDYFDTAYIYPGSEGILGSTLAAHGLREQVKIGTKLPLNIARKSEDFDRLFEEQLRRLQTDYVDYYFIHSVKDFAQWQRFCDMGIQEWLAKKKESGQIRHVGFSYHGTHGDFRKVLHSYDWEFTMLQYNYYDEHYQAGRAGLMEAAQRGLLVMIMEPLLGGRLATGLPKEAASVFRKADDSLSPADWALWWLWNQPEVHVVVSGMNTAAQVRQNADSLARFAPFGDERAAVYSKVQEIFRKSYKIPCTGCNYCLPCPKGVNIPACLSAYNASYAQNYFTGIKLYAIGTALTTADPLTPRNKCNNCGKCEPVCPQNIPIRNALRSVTRRFEKPPVRMIASAVRWQMGREKKR